MRRLRDWAGAVVTIGTAALEHWFGETMAMAVLTAVVVIFGGVLWRRVSMMMAAPQANNCTKAYAVEARLENYMTIMAPLASIVTANAGSTTNAEFLAGLSQIGPQSSNPASTLSVSTPGGTNASWYGDVASCLNGVITLANALASGLINHNYMDA